jgi:hypothetical protein
MKRSLVLMVLLAACSKPVAPPVIASFGTSAALIDAGGSTFLRYQVTGADKLSIDQGVGEVTGTNAVSAAPARTTTYTLIASNSGGSTSAQLIITVMPLAATLTSFSATPDSVAAGAPVTLKWTAANATSLALSATPADTVPALAPGATSVVVHPRGSTIYTLTVHGDGAKQPAPMSTIVAVGGVPVVALSAAQASVARGSAVGLSWTSSIEATFTLVATPHGGTAARTPLGTLRQTKVRPVADTDYAIEALAAGGTTTSNAVTVTVTGAEASSLSYQAPAPGSGDVVALQGSVANGVATLALVTVQPIAASALAVELPLDGATAGSRDGSVRAVLDASAAGDLSPGFTVDAALDPGRSPAAAIAALPASGPSSGVLMLAIAQKPSCAACNGGVGADATLPAGTRLGSVRLKVVPAAGAGPIFSSGALDALHGFRSVVKNAAGAVVGTVAVGSLSAQ